MFLKLPFAVSFSVLYIYIDDVVPLMKTAGVVENSEHCIYSFGLKCF